MEAWIIWIIAAALLLIVEVLTQMVWTFCLAIGCLCGMLSSFLGADPIVQTVVLAIATVVAYFVFMPMFKKWHETTDRKEGRDSRTGMDALLGRKAEVSDEIRPGETGRVRIDGDSWQVRAPHVKDTIARGEKVVVVGYDSIVLTVEKIEK